MRFVFRLFDRFRKPVAAEVMVEDDVFAIRLRKMQGRQRHKPKATPFRSSRQHSAV